MRTDPHGDFAMSFKEIGAIEGITAGGAYMACRSGLRKLRRKGVTMARLKELADELDRGRPAEEAKR